VCIEQMLAQIYQLAITLGPRLNEVFVGSEILGICSKLQIKTSAFLFLSDFNTTNLNQTSPQDLVAQIQGRLLHISNVVQIVAERIPRNNALYRIVSDHHLYIIFLDNNDVSISPDTVGADNNRQGNTDSSLNYKRLLQFAVFV
jgi:hypothetical protein